MLFKTNELLNTTFPIVKPVFKENWKRLLTPLLLISIILSVLPSLKSGVESNFINEADRIFRSQEVISIQDVLSHKFQNNSVVDGGGFFDNLPNILTSGNELILIIALYPVLIVLAFFFEYRSEKIKQVFSQRIYIKIREAAFIRVLNTNPSDVPEGLNTAGSLTNSLQIGTGYISSVYEFIGDIIQYGMALITAMLVLFSKNWLFGVSFLATLSIQVFVSRLRAKRLKENRNNLEKQRNDLAAQTDDILSKKEIILAFEQSPKYHKKISTLTGQYGELIKDIEVKNALYNGISRLISDVERFLIPLLALVFLVYGENGDITSGAGIYFLISLYTRLSVPVMNLLSQYDKLKSNEAVTVSLINLLKIPVKEKFAVKATLISELTEVVSFSNVDFQYKQDKMILKDVSFVIPQNKTTMILGPSGCGKSSIAKILLGFWPIQNGEIQLMGKSIASYNDDEIRLFSSYISQGDFITEETIRENLNWSADTTIITDQQMMDALVKVRLVKNISEISILDDLAKNLSGGGQQRLSLARVMLDEAPLLILDEPLTGIDVYTIRDIMPHFKSVLKERNRTVILISHKLSFANTADHLIILSSEGKVIEQGIPKDLLATQGSKFQEIYNAAKNELILT